MDAGVLARVSGLFDTGAAVVVATVDPEGRPSITRGWGPTVNEHGYVELCITAARGSMTRANLAANGRLALTVVDPTTYESAQVKGHVDMLRDPSDSESDRAAEHSRRFTDAVATVGMIDAACMMIGNLVTVGFTAIEVYDQTPGGTAGRAME